MKLISYWIALLFCICSSYVIGQQDLISYRSVPPSLNQNTQEKYLTLRGSIDSLDIKFIEINPLASVLDSGRLLISFPNLSTSSLLFETENIKYLSEEDYVWYGILPLSDTSHDYIGSCMLISKNGGKFGRIDIDSLVYLIDYLGDSITTISLLNDTTSSTLCGTVSDSTEASTLPTATLDNPNCKSRILILYTQASLDNNPDIEQRAITAFEFSEQALKNSRVNPDDLSIELAGIALLPEFEEGNNDSREILVLLRNQEQIETLRSQFKADIIAVAINPSDFGGPLGARSMTNHGFPIFVVERIPVGNIFTHEMGHCFFADHEACDAEIADPIECMDNSLFEDSHAHTWTWRKWFLGKLRRSGTIMLSRPDLVNDNVLNFSNPDVYAHHGYSGVEDLADNVKTMEYTGCLTAELDIQDVEDLYAKLIGPNSVCPCSDLVIEASVSGGYPGYYVYNWSYSFDGINYLDVPGTSSSEFELLIPCTGNPHNPEYPKVVYVFLNVNDGHTNSFLFKRITVNDEGDNGPCESLEPRSPFINTINDSTILGMELNPNPSCSEITLFVSAQTKDILSIKLLNLNGQVLSTQSNTISKGLNKIKIIPDNKSQGICFVQIISSLSKECIVLKAIIN